MNTEGGRYLHGISLCTACKESMHGTALVAMVNRRDRADGPVRCYCRS